VALATCAPNPEAHEPRTPSDDHAGNAAPAGHAPAVTVAEVVTVEGGRAIRLPGVTRATRRAELSFAVPARLAARPVEVGDAVRAGDVLATLDQREYRLAEDVADSMVAELDARLAQARRDLARVEQLAAARAATAEEQEQTLAGVSALEAAREAALARLAETRRLLDETALVAPFDGTVTAVYLEPGEWAAAGRPVLRLAGSDAVEVVVEAPESVRAGIVEGAVVGVTLPFLDRASAGRVRAVAGAAAGPGRLFQVEIDLDSVPGLVPGVAVEVELPVVAPRQLAVPVTAVVDPGSSRPAVFVVADGRARRVAVVPGRVSGELLTVEASLSPGDLVAVGGHTALVDGDRVEVAR